MLNAKGMDSYNGASREDLYLSIDKPLLSPLPNEPYVFSEWKKARVSLDYHIQFEQHYYSVPYRYVRKEVLLRITEKLLEIFHENELISSHIRSKVKFRFSTNSEHMPPAHRAVKSWTKESFISWAKSVGQETHVLTNAFLPATGTPSRDSAQFLDCKDLQRSLGTLLLKRRLLRLINDTL